MLSASSSRPSAKEPIDFDMLDPEELDMRKVMEWMRHGRNRFGFGGDNQKLVHSLSDEESRKVMSEKYAPHIVGFEKKPDVTLKAKVKTTQEMIDILNEFKLPTKFPARQNLPVGPPDDKLHSTGPLAESALMLFNQILTPFIKTFVIIKYYSLVTCQEGADEIINQLVDVIEKVASRPGMSNYEAASQALEAVGKYLDDKGINTRIMAQKFAEDQTKGNMVKFPFAVSGVTTLLETVKSYQYLRNVIKHMYVLMVNEVKIYQDYDAEQKIFNQTNVNSKPRDINAMVITGAIVPSGIAESNTIKPIDRPMISEDAHSEVFIENLQAGIPDQNQQMNIATLINQGNSVKKPSQRVTIPSGARYRLICHKTHFILAASDRYAPQLFLKMKYLMPLDIEFAVDLSTSAVHVYRVNKYGPNNDMNPVAYPYDPNLIRLYQNKIKFAINNGLNIKEKYYATIVEDTYSEYVGPNDHIHGPYEWENNEIVQGDTYNILVKYKKKNMPNRTRIKELCDGEKKLRPPMAKALLGPQVKDKFPKIPDYLHYNYAYACSYDIGNITIVSPEDARRWFKEIKGKRRLDKYRKFHSLKKTYDDDNGETVEY